MQLFLANPLGLLGLLLIPAIVLIHFFQRKARRQLIATAFLLEPQQLEQRSGRQFLSWQNSRQFWAQILASLLLTLLLVDLRWLKRETVTPVAIVVDASASMLAFQEDALAALKEQTASIERTADTIEWYLFDSSPRAKRYYKGVERSELLAAMQAHQPTLGAHEVTQALRVARNVVGETGRVIFLSDHKTEGILPTVEQISVGSDKPNVGITGVRCDVTGGRGHWEAVLRNYAETPRNLQWWVETPTGPMPKQTLQLAGNAMTTLSGVFPESVQELTLKLEPDAFTLDDTAPMVQPLNKRITYRVEGSDAFRELMHRFFAALPGVEPQANLQADTAAAELIVRQVDDLSSMVQEPTTHRIQFLRMPEAAEPQLQAPEAFMSRHPFVESLSFDGLLVTWLPDTSLVTASARPLLWRNEGTLVALNQVANHHSLDCYFDPLKSNVDRIPAMLILLHRFCESIKAQQLTFWRENFELHQPFNVSHTTAANLTLQTDPQAEREALLTPVAPAIPTLFTLYADDEALLRGASHFAEVREADFSKAERYEDLGQNNQAELERNSTSGFLVPLWALLAMACLLYAYHHS